MYALITLIIGRLKSKLCKGKQLQVVSLNLSNSSK